MTSFEDRIEQLRGAKPESTYELSAPHRTPEKQSSPEVWREKATLFEYDPAEMKIVDYNEEMAHRNSPYLEVMQDIFSSFDTVNANNNGYLKYKQRSYKYAGSEHSNEKILIGKIGNRICIVGDEEEEIIISPLFDSLLTVNRKYVDVQIGDHRLRLLPGSYEASDARPDSNRLDNYEYADSLPVFIEPNTSIRIAVLEHASKEVEASRPLEVEVAKTEHPFHAAHELFQGIHNAVVAHLTTQQPSHELVERLRQVDKALQLPSVQIDTQFYQLTFRTSPSADVIYLHNTSYKSDQDRVADVMQHMSIPDFLELATNDDRRHELLHETLADRGFYFIRQHTGGIFLMDRSTEAGFVISPDDPSFSYALSKAEGKLVEYFAGLADDTAMRTPFRSTRVLLADEIEQRIPKKATIKRNMARRILDWLNET